MVYVAISRKDARHQAGDPARAESGRVLSSRDRRRRSGLEEVKARLIVGDEDRLDVADRVALSGHLLRGGVCIVR